MSSPYLASLVASTAFYQLGAALSVALFVVSLVCVTTVRGKRPAAGYAWRGQSRVAILDWSLCHF